MLDALQSERLRVDHWRDKEATRDAVLLTMYNFLRDDATGLPTGYMDEEIQSRVLNVYRHVHRVYPRIPSPFYPQAEVPQAWSTLRA